jgi:hypothetical protein
MSRRRQSLPERRDEDLEARTRDQKSPRWSAEWRARRSQDARPPQGGRLMVAPLGAPFPSHICEGRDEGPATRGEEGF